MITIIQPGAFTTVQDEGRWGYQAYGLPIAGVMDRYAARMANLLAGNRPEAAVLEMTATGAAFKFDEEQLIAVCGADMQGLLKDAKLENWSSFFVPKGGEVRFSGVLNGYRTYLAVRGGFDVPPVLGSRSTYTRAKIGGHEGRSLRPGDVLYVGADFQTPAIPRRLALPYIRRYSNEITLSVMLGPQADMFAPGTLETFFQQAYKVTPKADRIGYGLQGPKLKALDKVDIISDAMCQGAIEIVANGMPFIMTADHQTTGGFAKLGSVFWADLPVLTQAKPGDVVRFVNMDEQAALAALRLENVCYEHFAELCLSAG